MVLTKKPLLLDKNRHSIEALISKFDKDFKLKTGKLNNWTPNMTALIASGLNLQSIINFDLNVDPSDNGWAQLILLDMQRIRLWRTHSFDGTRSTDYQTLLTFQSKTEFSVMEI